MWKMLVQLRVRMHGSGGWNEGGEEEGGAGRGEYMDDFMLDLGDMVGDGQAMGDGVLEMPW